jgi:hypothetical protein
MSHAAIAKQLAHALGFVENCRPHKEKPDGDAVMECGGKRRLKSCLGWLEAVNGD